MADSSWNTSSSIHWDGTQWIRHAPETARQRSNPPPLVYEEPSPLLAARPVVPQVIEPLIQPVVPTRGLDRGQALVQYANPPLCQCYPPCGVLCKAFRLVDQALTSIVSTSSRSPWLIAAAPPAVSTSPADAPPRGRSFDNSPRGLASAPLQQQYRGQQLLSAPPISQLTRRYSDNDFFAAANSPAPSSSIRSRSADRGPHQGSESTILYDFPDPLIFEFLQDPRSQWNPDNSAQSEELPPPSYIESQWLTAMQRQGRSGLGG